METLGAIERVTFEYWLKAASHRLPLTSKTAAHKVLF